MNINLPINRFIGSKKEVASFESYRPSGPIVKLIPKSSGNGVVIAVVDDPNYADVIEPAMHDFSVTAPLALEPDGVFLLQGGVVHFSLVESGVDSSGKETKNGRDRIRDSLMESKEALMKSSSKISRLAKKTPITHSRSRSRNLLL